jgi:phosphate transport system permease protein
MPELEKLQARVPLATAITSTGGGRSFAGLSLDTWIKYFFTVNAFVAIVILGLITFSLLQQGSGFFPLQRQAYEVYRLAGLEYVQHVMAQVQDYERLTRLVNTLRTDQFAKLQASGKPDAEAQAALKPLDDWKSEFESASSPLNRLLRTWKKTAESTKEKWQVNEERHLQQARLLKEGKADEAKAIEFEIIDWKADFEPVRSQFDKYVQVNAAFAQKLNGLVDAPPALPMPGSEALMQRLANRTHAFTATFPEIENTLRAWDQNRSVSIIEPLFSFLFGAHWITNSSWQDFYGIAPLFTGSLLISVMAIFIAVPFGVGAAIYVNQMATPWEQNLIKPYIEFISAIPSVVLGLFGVVVFGQFLREISQWPALAWIPGFPMQERLNAFTAGALLGLMAVPTIFTLSEDAINNVPRAYKEASYALGATRLQTIVRILIPASLSGLASAVLLGFGRVIGETMVVLLCAGGRIELPDLSMGLGMFFEPTHTMTGIIAQETGEVEAGSLHFTALFMVGILLFAISLLINWIAQIFVKKYKISIG